MQTIVLKLSGELFAGKPGQPNEGCMNTSFVRNIAQQIKKLTPTHHISIVVGGGNFFRGAKNGPALGLTLPTADTVGMLATIMNALMLRDVLSRENVAALALSAYPIAGIINPIDQTVIDQAKANNTVIIFAGGTGNPFFTTDTASVLRALQVGASTIWKATTVDAVYDADPAKNPSAKPLKMLTYETVLSKKLGVMDMTAFALAQEHRLTIRVFDLFTPDALHNVATNSDFGSTITYKE